MANPLNKLDKLRALTGYPNAAQVPIANPKPESPFGNTISSGWEDWSSVKASNIYDGTDSEDDEMIMNRKTLVTTKPKAPQRPQVPYFATPKGSNMTAAADRNPAEGNARLINMIEVGQIVHAGPYCPFNTLKKYPYNYIGVANRKRVTENYFDRNLLFLQHWTFYYLYRGPEDANQQPIILVQTNQVEAFLGKINVELQTVLTIPYGSKGAFALEFRENDGTPRPRFLGESYNKKEFEHLQTIIPNRNFKPAEEGPAPVPLQSALAEFQKKIELMVSSQKSGNKKASKEKRAKERQGNQKQWNHLIKRVQRYLGLRSFTGNQREAIRHVLQEAGLEWLELENAVDAKMAELPPSTHFDAETPASFEQEDSVVFVCVDVEAYEKDTKKVTEIGVATLDTKDIGGVAPGEGGKNWMPAIRARHFRINEHKHLNNSEFVNGCAGDFQFGTSEFINLADAPYAVAMCFKHPFSEPDVEPIDENPKRSVILVGHDIDADINFLRTIGYDVHNLSNLQEVADTATMWKYHKRETNPRNLGSVLAELGLETWFLHNAGNDAVYTLQAMVGIAIKHLNDHKKEKQMKDTEKTEVSGLTQGVAELAVEKDEGWKSGGSDGGVPLPPIRKVIHEKVAPKPNPYLFDPWKKSSPALGPRVDPRSHDMPTYMIENESTPRSTTRKLNSPTWSAEPSTMFIPSQVRLAGGLNPCAAAYETSSSRPETMESSPAMAPAPFVAAMYETASMYTQASGTGGQPLRRGAEKGQNYGFAPDLNAHARAQPPKTESDMADEILNAPWGTAIDQAAYSNVSYANSAPAVTPAFPHADHEEYDDDDDDDLEEVTSGRQYIRMTDATGRIVKLDMW